MENLRRHKSALRKSLLNFLNLCLKVFVLVKDFEEISLKFFVFFDLVMVRFVYLPKIFKDFVGLFLSYFEFGLDNLIILLLLSLDLNPLLLNSLSLHLEFFHLLSPLTFFYLDYLLSVEMLLEVCLTAPEASELFFLVNSRILSICYPLAVLF